jgi:anthranilate synthase component 1
MEVLARGNAVTIIDHNTKQRQAREEHDPMEVVVQLSSQWRPALPDGLPTVFTGGWVGYCGYDTVRYVYTGARRPAAHLPAGHRHNLGMLIADRFLG